MATRAGQYAEINNYAEIARMRELQAIHKMIEKITNLSKEQDEDTVFS